MLPTRSPNYNSQKRGNPYVRRPAQLSRSGSILSTIRNIVTAPLSWWSANEEFEDINGKRKRFHGVDSPGDQTPDGSKTKRLRMHSPPRSTAGYLDPPKSTFSSFPIIQKTFDMSNRKQLFEGGRTPEPLTPLNGRRTMSIDYVAERKTSLTGENSRDGAIKRDVSMGVRNSISLQRDTSMPPPPTPLRVRTSLTPQPSPTKPARREASAPPPLTSLMSKPMFVKAPFADKSELGRSRKLEEQKTTLLGTLAEASRKTRSPIRELSIPKLAPNGNLTFVSQSQENIRILNAAEKTLHDLDIYKSPIVPTRYRDAAVIPHFLKPRKAHVPIPMPAKERKTKPSLGMANKVKIVEKGVGKPYAGEGGLSKLLARRRAEEEQLSVSMAEKKDVGVSTASPDGDEDDDNKYSSSAVQTLLSYNEDSSPIFSGREKSSGKAGRIRITRREPGPGVRAISAGGDRNRNKFSATFEDEGASEDQIMVDGPIDSVSAKINTTGSESLKEAIATVYSAPSGFSFPTDSSSIVHDYGNAKEPPIGALPFSFTKESIQPTKSAPLTSKDSNALQLAEKKPVEFASRTLVSPQLNIVPPTPEQSTTSSRLDLFLTTPSTVTSQQNAIESENTGKLPNFFATSSYLTKESEQPSDVSVPSVLHSKAPVPVKDAENPLWEGEKMPNPAVNVVQAGSRESTLASAPLQAEVLRPRSTEPKPLPFGGFNRPSTTNVFGSSSQNVAAPSITSTSPALSNVQATTQTIITSSTPNLPSTNLSVFSQNTAANAPIMASSLVTDTNLAPPKSTPSPFAFSSTPPPTAKNADTTPTFNFGTPPSTGVSENLPSPSLPFSPKPLFASDTKLAKPLGSDKSAFAFASPPSTPPAGVEKVSAPVFNNTTTTSTNFAFGTNTSSGSGTTQPVFNGSFGFAPSSRPVTPPQDKEVRMDESPTRDLNGKADVEAKHAASFSFGGSSSFRPESTNSPTSPFTFGTTPSPNPFENKSESKSAGFSFNRIASAPASSSGFGFGQKQTSDAPTTPAFTSQPGAFGQNTSSNSPFMFGNSSPVNPFAQATSPAPGSVSPSHFQQPAPASFSFTPPATMPNNPFNFVSSQPTSPSVGNSTALQSPSTTNSPFIFGQPANSQQSSTPTNLPSSSSGTLFNIGSAPPSTGPGTPRQMKKLPRRGMGGKR